MGNTNQKKAQNEQAQAQKKHLQQLLLDMQLLFNLAKGSLEEASQRDEIAQIMIELKGFAKILDQKEEYTIEQVNAVASRINEFTNMFSKIKDHKDVIALAKNKFDEVAKKELGNLYRGENPLQLMKVEFTVTDDFAKRMSDLAACCQKVDASLELVKANSPGHKFGKMEAIVHACKRAKDAVVGYFNLGIAFAKELKYYANRALIVTSFKVATPEESLEAAERKKQALEEELRKTNATILGTQIQLKSKESQTLKGKSTVFNKKVKKDAMIIASKASHMNEKQKELLKKVFWDLQKLTAWSSACMPPDSPQLQKLQQMNIELMAFNKILEKDQEFSDEQLAALVDMVAQSTKMLSKFKSSDDVIKEAERKIGIEVNAVLAKMNHGEKPITNENITVQLAPDFTKKMLDIGNCCQSLERNVKAMQTAFPARKYDIYDKLANAAMNAKKGFAALFNAGITLAKEVQYYGKRALIVTQFVIPTPEDRLERIGRKQAHLVEKERQVQAEQLGTVVQMKQKARDEQKANPKIFKSR